MPYMGELKQSTQVTKTVLMVDAADHVTGKAGLTITKYLTKAGGTPTSATMTTSELDSTNAKGIYSLVFSTSHTDTLGDFQLHLSGTGADPADYWWTVVARLTDDLAYPATSGRSMVVDAAGLVDANAVKVGPTGSGTAQTAYDIGGKLGSPAGASVSADIAAVKAETASIQSDTNDIQTRIPAALVGGRMDANVSAIGGDTAALAAFKRAVLGTAIFTCDSGSSTTSIITSSMTPAAAVADQFQGKLLTFAQDTTTANLRGQSTPVLFSTAGGVLTVDTLTDAPVSGDTGSIS